MYEILEKTQLSERVFELRIEASAIARHAHTGQFLIVRANGHGERVPFSIADWDPEEGWVEFGFMVKGKTTAMLAAYEAGDRIQDVAGPLGQSTEMEPGLWCVICAEEGLVGAYSFARQLVRAGNVVHAIMGAPTSDGLMLKDRFVDLLGADHLHIATEDGSVGETGTVCVPLNRLLKDKVVDHLLCVGPVPMMRACAEVAKRYGVPIIASTAPLMVDGTGMCGCCRVEVDGTTKLACVEGPLFDATKIGWDSLEARQATYRAEEARSLAAYEEACACHR